MKNNNSRTKKFTIGLLILTSVCSLTSTASQFSNALNENNLLGLYRSNQFQLSQGACKNCAITPQSSWYFEQETIAIPLSNTHSFDPTLSAQDDVKQWVASQVSTSMPPLVWLGSPHVAVGKLSQDGKLLENENSKTQLSITPKIESNQSYYNEASKQHFASRNLVMRGTADQTHFTARSIWPVDYNLDLNQIPYKPLTNQV